MVRRSSRKSGSKEQRHPKVLARIYNNRLRTLHELILELLGPTLAASKPQDHHASVLDFDAVTTQPEHADGPEWSLIRSNDSPEFISLLQDSFAAVSDGAPAPGIFSLDNRFTQQEVVLRAIEVQFQKTRRPLHVLCSGYRQPCPSKDNFHQGLALQGVESVFWNTTYEVVTATSWSVLLSRVGDMLMLYLLSHTSIFIPLPNNCYLQVAGYPISLSASSQQTRSTSVVEKNGILMKRQQKQELTDSNKSSAMELKVIEERCTLVTWKKSGGAFANLPSSGMSLQVGSSSDSQSDKMDVNGNIVVERESHVKNQRQLLHGPSIMERIVHPAAYSAQTSISEDSRLAVNTTEDPKLTRNLPHAIGKSLSKNCSKKRVSREESGEWLSRIEHNQILKPICKKPKLDLERRDAHLSSGCINDIKTNHELLYTQDATKKSREGFVKRYVTTLLCEGGEASKERKLQFETTLIGSHAVRKMPSQHFSRVCDKSSKCQQFKDEKISQGTQVQSPNPSSKTKSRLLERHCIDANGPTHDFAINDRQGVKLVNTSSRCKQRIIDRKPIFYRSKFSCYPGLPENHIILKSKPNNNGALFLYRYIFKSSEETLAGFSSQEVTSSSVSDIKLKSRAEHCQYGRLLSRHCPIPKFRTLDSDNGNSTATKTNSETKLMAEQVIDMVNVDISLEEGYLTQEELATDCISASSSEEFEILEKEAVGDMSIDSQSDVQFVLAGDADDPRDASIFEPRNSASCFGSLEKDALKPKLLSSENEAIKGEPNKSPSQEHLLSIYTSHHQVVSFLWAACRRIIPEELLGSCHNWRILRRSIACFVGLRRYEVFSVQNCMHKLKVSEFPWLQVGRYDSSYCKKLPVSRGVCHKINSKVAVESPDAFNLQRNCIEMSQELKLEAKCLAATEHVSQQRRLEDFLFWIFDGLLVPLIWSHFYVTERESHRQIVFYYRKPVWEAIKSTAFSDLARTLYRKLPPAAAAEFMSKRILGIPQIRLLPKKNGIRPIAKLGSASKSTLSLNACSQVNLVDKEPTNFATLKKRPFRYTTIAGKCKVTMYEPAGKREQDKSIRGKQFLCQKQHQQEQVKYSTRSSFDKSSRCPKADGNTSSSFLKSVTAKQVFHFRPVNSVLQDIHQCLKYEQRRHPGDMGFSVFDYNDVYSKLLMFTACVKNHPGGIPELFMAVCDVAKAFDTIKQDKLSDIMRTFVQEQQYFVVRFTSVIPTARSVRVLHERACTLAGENRNFLELASSMTTKRSHTIFTDQVCFSRVKRERVLEMIDEHVKRNLLQMGNYFLHQMIGIPQGSILSPLMCSIYYGHLELHHLVPLLQSGLKPQAVLDTSVSTVPNTCSRKRKISVFSELQESCEDEAQLILASSFCECNGVGPMSQTSIHKTLMPRIPNSGRSATQATSRKNHGSMQRTNSQCLLSRKHSGSYAASANTESLLMRMIDDSLLISTSKNLVSGFLMKMHKGFDDYGCYVNEQKTCLSFDLQAKDKCYFRCTYQTEDGASFMRWNGLLINCHTLEVQADYTRYCGEDIKTTLTVWRSLNPGLHYICKLCQFMRPKCHPLFYDQRINSLGTICLNAYQAFMLCAMKSHAYLCSMPSVGCTNTSFLLHAILRTARFMYQLMKQKLLAVGGNCNKFLLKQQELEWLGIHAFHTVLLKKQSRYKELLLLLQSRFQADKYCHMAQHPHLLSAIDEKRSSMFKYIRY
ncbi:hypothetical protein O6H91_05G029300 [Diphasiastrum complanatum]|uniref:Uncharacterized protein n=1 Tax=Diphasiastrum complanatum TaxID=34168 RepID=A0ACC2DMQ5_DIPCM|nr:hypothetical protein O6H91_05G029300 [Diphasiastrum complanatum]